MAGTIVDPEGRESSLEVALFPGDTPAPATLLVFWASWCQPCIGEIPVLNELHRYYGKRGLRVVGLGVTNGGETLEKMVEAATNHGVAYPVFFDAQGAVEKAFGLSAIPTSALIDSRKTVRWLGPNLPRDINKRIEEAMEGLTPSESE
jgi:thiol-disulfide isomerase/thioredoxin